MYEHVLQQLLVDSIEALEDESLGQRWYPCLWLRRWCQNPPHQTLTIAFRLPVAEIVVGIWWMMMIARMMIANRRLRDCDC